MPTSSKIAETAFRLGCGRYIQESGALHRIGEEILLLNRKKPYIIGGEKALLLTQNLIRKSLAQQHLEGIFYTYTGFCCKETCEILIESPDFQGCDVVIGVGGGNIMDAAKYCAGKANLPVINVPTSSATCAAFTPLSVCYNRKGQTVGSIHHKKEVNKVIVDMDILCRQPVRLLVAGIYDSLAKLYEINQRLLGTNLDDVDIGLAASYQMSRYACEFLNRKKAECIADVAAGRLTKTVYDVVYITMALTGVISGLARGSNQCAIAHKVYEVSRTLFPKEVYSVLHGELVAIGLIAQIAYNQEISITPEQFAIEMRELKMPTTLHELGIPVDENVLQSYYDKIVTSSAMAGTNDGERKKLRCVLQRIL